MTMPGSGVCSECGADITHLHGLAATCEGECRRIRDRRTRAKNEIRRYHQNRDKMLERERARRENNRERYRERGREWYHANRDRARRINRRARYGVETPLDPPTICEVCGDEGVMCLDHDHKTGKFRGWLCGCCNRALGQAKDDPDRLRKLILYLERTK